MAKKIITKREADRAQKAKMYKKYIHIINSDSKCNKSDIKALLAKKYGYKNGNVVHTIIWEIEKNNGKKSRKKDSTYSL